MGVVVGVGDAESFQLFLLKHLTHSEDDNNYDGYCYFGWDFQCNKLFEKGNWTFNRLATEEEKQKLFDTIKANGYKWNTKTKTLEKLVEPKFKVGDKIRHKDSGVYCHLGEYSEGISAYRTSIGLAITCKDLEQWELAPNKFDITTLKPFDKVLVRTDNSFWRIGFFEKIEKKNKRYPFVCMGYNKYSQCIPYEGNEHLLGTTNDCDEFYKNW